MTRRHGHCRRGARLVAKVPHGRWRTLTFLAALRHDRIAAPCVIDGPINGTSFRAYVEQFLVPTLSPGDVVLQRPYPPLWSACGSDETAQLTGSLGMGGLFGSEGGPDRVEQLMAIYREALRTGRGNREGPAPRAALMTAGFCHEDPRVVAERGTELVAWYIEQQRERARLVWRDYDPTTVPPDYQGYFARDQRLAAGPHPGEPTPQEMREQGTKFCVGTPEDCIRFLELYEALGIEEVILLCAIGPAQHEEVLHTLRLFGEEVIPHFQAKQPIALASASA